MKSTNKISTPISLVIVAIAIVGIPILAIVNVIISTKGDFSSFYSYQDGICVLAPDVDQPAIDRAISNWASSNNNQQPDDYNLSINRADVILELEFSAGNLVYHYALDKNCKLAGLLALSDSTLAGDSYPEAVSLSEGVGLIRAKSKSFDSEKFWRAIFHPNLIHLAILQFLLLYGFYRGRNQFESVSVSEVVILAGSVFIVAIPMLHVPFTLDSSILRIAYARDKVFGDWNHPFLSYLLNKPVAKLSLEPWILRLVPLAGLVAETILLVMFAARKAGRLAGILAGVWFVCQIPYRRALLEIGDWELASIFMLAQLLWLDSKSEKTSPISWPSWIGFVILVVGGVCSSWIMIVPALSILIVLTFDTRHRLLKITLRQLIVLAVSIAPFVLLAIGVFEKGQAVDEAKSSFVVLMREMLTESSLGRVWLMGIPIAVGLGWLTKNIRQILSLQICLTLLLVPIAVIYAWKTSHVNGGYYIAIITPILFLISSVGLAKLWKYLNQYFDGRMAVVTKMVAFILIFGLIVASVQYKPFKSNILGMEAVVLAERIAREESLPILSNHLSVVYMIGYYRYKADKDKSVSLVDTLYEFQSLPQVHYHSGKTLCEEFFKTEKMQDSALLLLQDPVECLQIVLEKCRQLSSCPDGYNDKCFSLYRCWQ